jgi:hypothetical protein
VTHSSAPPATRADSWLARLWATDRARRRDRRIRWRCDGARGA